MEISIGIVYPVFEKKASIRKDAIHYPKLPIAFKEKEWFFFFEYNFENI